MDTVDTYMRVNRVEVIGLTGRLLTEDSSEGKDPCDDWGKHPMPSKPNNEEKENRNDKL